MKSPARARWILIGTVALQVAFFALAAFALRQELGAMSAGALSRAFRAIGWAHMIFAFAWTATSLLMLGAIEILALREAGVGPERVRRPKALVTALLAHAFSQVIGVALITGAAVRRHAYPARQVNGAALARITTYVVAAASLGFLAIGSSALLLMPSERSRVALPFSAHIVGALLALIVLGYVAWSRTARRDRATARSWRQPPPVRTVAVQIGLSSLDWIATALALFVLLPTAPSWPFVTFLTAYLVAQAVAMVSPVPGGAGVFEATLLALLAVGDSLDARAGFLASLIVYRFVYYLAPLVVATAAAAVIEARRAHAYRQKRRDSSLRKTH